MNATALNHRDTLELQARTVLLIDDEPANLGVLSAYLEGAGLQVLVARDGESGLDQAQYAQPPLTTKITAAPLASFLGVNTSIVRAVPYLRP